MIEPTRVGPLNITSVILGAVPCSVPFFVKKITVLSRVAPTGLFFHVLQGVLQPNQGAEGFFEGVRRV